MKQTKQTLSLELPLFGTTIFLSAFLLFQLEPMISKVILPWFGGGPAVWTAAMLFFQVALLGGYAYAHFLSRFSLLRQSFLHFTVVAAVIVWLILLTRARGVPILPEPGYQPKPDGMPVWQVLAILVSSIGIPFLLLSTTSSLLQAWFSRVEQRRSPYAFYALSNAASLLALLSYLIIF
jgi:hypothetical protein